MNNLLQFNPFYRMTAFEYATTFPIFDCVRNPKLESKLVNMVEFVE